MTTTDPERIAAGLTAAEKRGLCNTVTLRGGSVCLSIDVRADIIGRLIAMGLVRSHPGYIATTLGLAVRSAILGAAES